MSIYETSDFPKNSLNQTANMEILNVKSSIFSKENADDNKKLL